MRLNSAIPFALLVAALQACSSDTPSTGPGTTPPAPALTAGTGAPAASPAAGTGTTPAATPPVVAPPQVTPPVAPPTSAAGSAAPAALAGSAAPAATAGSAAVAPTATAGAAGTGAPGTAAPGTGMQNADPRGKCTLNSGYPSDESCILPPSAEEGMQIHVGPSDYKNTAEVAKYLLQPGQEVSECWTFHTPNEKDVYYQTYELSGRAGTHHIINTMYRSEMQDGGFGVCADPGIGTNANILDNLPGASKAYMPRGHVAPENESIGRKIPANTPAQADMHYFNFTEKPIIREFWMNIFFVDAAKVTKQADQIRAMGGLGWTIPAHSEMTYKYSAPIMGSGRILSLLGHYHAHGKRFTAFLQRSGSTTPEKVFEMYDYLDPAAFEYDSVSQNPTFSENAAGALSGMLEVKAGDTLMWECHIVNDSDVALTYKNEVKTGEMCNLWGSSLGITPLNVLRP